MVVLTAVAAAQEAVEVWGDAPDPEEVGARVTSVDPRALPASADLATAAARAPGVAVRRLGGLGDPAQIGLRGSGARHTEVWWDGVPLNPEGGEALDVSDLPLAAFGRVDVIRGATPTSAAIPALGGALWLVSRRDAVEQADLSAGSFGAARGVLVEGVGGRVPALFVLDGLSTAGDFPWYDDRGTRNTQRDDRVVRRENNAARRVSTLARADLGPVTVSHAATVREDGIPGFTTEPARASSFGLHRHLLGASARADLGPVTLSGVSFGLWRRERWRDPLGEVGLGVQDDTADLWSVGAAPTARAPLSPAVAAELALHARAEGATTRSRDGAVDARSRAVGRAQVGLRAASGPLAAWPTAALVAVTGADGSATLLALPRASVRADLGPIAVSATGGASGRPPDLIELYGDRGAQVGNPALRPERGVGVDLGVSGGRDLARAELVAFAARQRDLVVWIPTPQGVARPENVGVASLLGVEGGVSGEGDRGGGSLAATILDARQRSDDPAYDGRRLPRVPLAELVAAGHLTLGPADLGLDASATTATFADAANLRPEAPRVLLGATARLAPAPRLRLELDVRNALGTRTAPVPRDPLVDDGRTAPRALEDFGGYPLPGRSVTATVRWSR